MKFHLSKSDAEEAALGWIEVIGYPIVGSVEIAPGQATVERERYEEVIIPPTSARSACAIEFGHIKNQLLHMMTAESEDRPRGRA